MTVAAETVGDDERLARFVLSTGWLYKDKRPGCPLRPSAFMPYPGPSLSVYRIDGWTETMISIQGRAVADQRERKHREKQLAEGKDYPEAKRTFRFLGRGELHARDARSIGLDVAPDEPPPRHANIVGWPALGNDRKADEAAHMAYALLLQAAARYVPAESIGRGPH